ncbi:Fungal-trans domain containing protein [Pyrenophora tritici-repentis]|nr:Fungal-trans domain containing protein [Pyrenophora tritici-repentis]PWO20989.1 GlcD, FADFMN-containing dehydrogenase [Pyrenophora tritici-repentis]
MAMAPRKGTRRACDPCSIRKVRCDGNDPCSRCEAASWDCTYLKTHGKSGPKGPRRTTEAAIRRLQERSKCSRANSRSNSETSYDTGSPVPADLPYLDPIPLLSDHDAESRAWPDIKSPPVSVSHHQEPQRISTACLSQYLEHYQKRGYGIWPVVDTDALTGRLLTHPNDFEAYALANAICAAIVSQFSIGIEPGSPVEGHYRIPSAVFEFEAKKARNESDHLENVTIYSLLGSFFLHVYSANVGRMNASTVLLGEAIFKAHILGLHKTTHYQTLAAEQTQYALRVYWLLFITERAHSLQHDVPTTLKRTPDLPRLEDLQDGSVTPAFVQLCRLFNILDVTITAEPASARQALALAQQQLSCDEDPRSLENEIQRADITMTQQWMRIFLWQHALNVTNLSSRASQDEEFSFRFPAKVAQNVLSNLSSLSRQSVEAHGPGMESKIFDVANSLADVMMIMPSLNHESRFDVGPRDLIHSLAQVLGNFRGGNPSVINILQGKLTTLGFAAGSPQKLIDLSSPEEEYEEWHGRTMSAPSTYPSGPRETPISPSLQSSMSMDGSLMHQPHGFQ